MSWANVVKSNHSSNSTSLLKNKIKIKTKTDLSNNTYDYLNDFNIYEEYNHLYFLKLFDNISDCIFYSKFNNIISPSKIYDFFDQFITKEDFVQYPNYETDDSSDEDDFIET